MPARLRDAEQSLASARAKHAREVTDLKLHRHSGIRVVTPDPRHDGRECDVLASRVRVYERARRRHPNRWSRSIRNWTPAPTVFLNRKRDQETIEGALSRATTS
jgi:hypothetical protein